MKKCKECGSSELPVGEDSDVDTCIGDDSVTTTVSGTVVCPSCGEDRLAFEREIEVDRSGPKFVELQEDHADYLEKCQAEGTSDEDMPQDEVDLSANVRIDEINEAYFDKNIGTKRKPKIVDGIEIIGVMTISCDCGCGAEREIEIAECVAFEDMRKPD